MDSNRKFYYGKTHEHARDLGLEDVAYRSALYALTGKRSCTELSHTPPLTFATCATLDSN